MPCCDKLRRTFAARVVPRLAKLIASILYYIMAKISCKAATHMVVIDNNMVTIDNYLLLVGLRF